jgi:hypothetical protein
MLPLLTDPVSHWSIPLSYTSPPSPYDQMFKDNGFTLLLGGVFFQGVHQYIQQFLSTIVGILINKKA